MARLTYKDVKEYIESFEGYKLLSPEYKNGKTKLEIHHECCNKSFPMDYEHFKRGQRCPYCRKNADTNTNDFKKKIKNKYNDKYTVLGEYKNNRTKILTRHNICGHEWSPRPDNLLNGYGCPKCGGSEIKDTEWFKEQVFLKYGDEYTVLGEYKNSASKILLRHNCKDCNNNEFEMKVGNFLYNDTRCPKCYSKANASKGEQKIAKWLDKHGFTFEREARFEECKDIQILPFDFYVELGENEFMLIEYDGKQHFKSTGYHTKEKVEGIQRRDSIKNNFCKEYDIKLLRIPYTEYKNIDNILLETFND